MKVFTYIAGKSYFTQTIVILADSKEEAFTKLLAYLPTSSFAEDTPNLDEIDEETEDVFQTFGVDG